MALMIDLQKKRPPVRAANGLLRFVFLSKLIRPSCGDPVLDGAEYLAINMRSLRNKVNDSRDDKKF